MIMRLLAALVVLVSTASAAEIRLAAAAIVAVLSDKSLYGEENGAPVEQIFQNGGQTFYLVNGASSNGLWEVRGDQYCSIWPPSPAWACYDVFQDGETITFVSGSGNRFPMRVEKQLRIYRSPVLLFIVVRPNIDPKRPVIQWLSSEIGDVHTGTPHNLPT